MFREILKVKIHNATVTDTVLEYAGSITIDPSLLAASGLVEYEKVSVVNLNNGARFDTFVIKARKDTGKVCLNGPAARLGYPGDKIHILAYSIVDEKERRSFKTKFVYVSEKNTVTKTKEVGQK